MEISDEEKRFLTGITAAPVPHFVAVQDLYEKKERESYYTHIAQNILAEASTAFRESRESRCSDTFQAWRSGDELVVDLSREQEPANCHLRDNIVEVNGKPFWISSCELQNSSMDSGAVLEGWSVGHGRLEDQPRHPSGSIQIEVRLFARDYLSRYVAAMELKSAGGTDMERALLNPRAAVRGTYPDKQQIGDVIPANEHQERAIQNLNNRLEIIHGPPGTGKSTTIFHIISANRSCLREGEGAFAVCCAVTNQAVDSIAEKLGRTHDEHFPILIVGSSGRMGKTAEKFTLDALCEREPEVVAARKEVQRIRQQIGITDEKLALAKLKGVRDEVERLEHQRVVHEVAETSAESALDAELEATRRRIVCRTSVFLCTISSSYKVQQLQRYHSTSEAWKGVAEPRRLLVVILDEAGATPESYAPLMLCMRPENVILLGDHMQLPPLVIGSSAQRGKQLDRSLMERALDCGAQEHPLLTQYRMPAKLCKLVSALSYAGKLKGDSKWLRDNGSPREVLQWLKTSHGEARLNNSKINVAEVAHIACLLKHDPVLSRNLKDVKVIALYKAQVDLIKFALSEMGIGAQLVSVVSVDAAQGSEAPHVVLSTTRSNATQDPGFARDRRRLNVAISRAQASLTIVGNYDFFHRVDTNWRQVCEACVRVDGASTQENFEKAMRLVRAKAHEMAPGFVEECVHGQSPQARTLDDWFASRRLEGGQRQTRSLRPRPSSPAMAAVAFPSLPGSAGAADHAQPGASSTMWGARADAISVAGRQHRQQCAPRPGAGREIPASKDPPTHEDADAYPVLPGSREGGSSGSTGSRAWGPPSRPGPAARSTPVESPAPLPVPEEVVQGQEQGVQRKGKKKASKS
mmetsp:Transcript_122522/g.332683  ORF Transcript_122522/g.332683 Transcript_122522/m.332683 type:complete len:864 (-) Transcript_122522:102-2693(-)